MTALKTERLVDDYLRRLHAAAERLDKSGRDELVAEIGQHIETALEQEGSRGEAAVRNVLERLGEPDEIVDAAEPSPRRTERCIGALEIAALIALVIPIVGWIAGVVLVLVSHAWSGREKLVGLLLALWPALVPLVLIAAGSGSETQEPVAGRALPVPTSRTVIVTPTGVDGGDGGLGALEVATLLFMFLAGLPSALYLGWRLRRVTRNTP